MHDTESAAANHLLERQLRVVDQRNVGEGEIGRQSRQHHRAIGRANVLAKDERRAGHGGVGALLVGEEEGLRRWLALVEAVRAWNEASDVVLNVVVRVDQRVDGVQEAQQKELLPSATAGVDRRANANDKRAGVGELEQRLLLLQPVGDDAAVAPQYAWRHARNVEHAHQHAAKEAQRQEREGKDAAVLAVVRRYAHRPLGEQHLGWQLERQLGRHQVVDRLVELHAIHDLEALEQRQQRLVQALGIRLEHHAQEVVGQQALLDPAVSKRDQRRHDVGQPLWLEHHEVDALVGKVHDRADVGEKLSRELERLLIDDAALHGPLAIGGPVDLRLATSSNRVVEIDPAVGYHRAKELLVGEHGVQAFLERQHALTRAAAHERDGPQTAEAVLVVRG